MAEVINESIFRGTDANLVFTAKTPTNIAGWTLQFDLEAEFGDSPSLVSKSTGSGITITDEVLGVFAVRLSATETTLAPGWYACDVHRVDPGAVTCLASGKIRIKPVARV